ncbi:MAG: hypothetical protein HY769_05780 [Candidatus Stahlbacteria bacterium]|nr:hypothetical protein [Candidatus Stahlbacteria bacterium]
MYRYIVSGVTVFILLSGLTEGSRWSTTGSLQGYGKCGFQGAGLTDGKLIIIGGMGDDDSYEIFDPSTGLWKRYDFIYTDAHKMAMLLPNGKVIQFAGSVRLYDPFTNSWTLSGASFNYNDGQLATLLKDGNVLIVTYPNYNSYLYNYIADAITPTDILGISTSGCVQVMLSTGEVLVTGTGVSGTDGPCAIYDPISGTWASTNPLVTGRRSSHQGVLLPPPWNKVLIAGGGDGSSKVTCELYDPISGIWSTTGDLHSTFIGIAALALLPEGKPLFIGGEDYSGGTVQCEIYDPDMGSWSITDSMQIARSHFSTAILQTGKVIAIAGTAAGIGDIHNKCEIYDPSQPVWTTKTSLNNSRCAHTATLLPIIHTINCSTNVLVTGGEYLAGYLKSCELYNYINETVSLTGDLNVARSHHAAMLLPSGKVLVAGGKNSTGPINSCELYDANTEIWSFTGTMIEARFDHTATLLKDGRTFVTGGENSGIYSNTCEVYNSGIWSSAATMATRRARHTAVILLNGNILVIGGETTGGVPTTSCELWNGTSWSNAAPLNTARSLHTATLLQSGKVLVVGGKGSGSAALNSCEIYDPIGNIWNAEANLNTARYAHNTILLYSGLVSVTGGYNGTSISSCEIWDPAAEWNQGPNTHSWKVTTPLTTARAYHSSVLIPDTMPFVLAIGGNNGGYLNSVEEYDVRLGYRSEWQSTITNYQAITSISTPMNIEGTLFRGVSEADGGNYCHIMSNDHPLISLVRIGGGNWQGNGGGEIMYIPLSSSWDALHTDINPPADYANGYYRLWAIVNGIPTKWYKECSPSGVSESKEVRVKSLELRIVRDEIKFYTSERGAVNLRMYNICGRLENELLNGVIEGGYHIVKLPAMRNGIYFVRLVCNTELHTAKVVSIK